MKKKEFDLDLAREFGKTSSLWHASIEFHFWAGYRMCTEINCEYTTKKKRYLKEHLDSKCENWNNYFDIFEWKYTNQ